ncbi:MAG: S-layer homology domain-containing protein [Anaerolineaceae bacterium]|nr:MAG: S-layer homology domain-containing protein [Anaerolineaceae bacterium]
MKQKRLMSIIAVIILAIVTFWAGSVYAATNCFTDTNGHKFEQAICWMKTNGLANGTKFFPDNFTTRGQAAQWIQKSVNIPPANGLILISAGYGDWQSFNSTDNVSTEIYSSGIYFKKTTTGSNFLSLHPSIPTVFYGRSLKLVAVELCYTASANVVLSYIEINTYTHTNSPGSRILQFSDATDRTDSACRYYALPTAVRLTPEDGANIFIQGVWNAANSPLIVGRTTFVLAPTGVKATPPSDADVTVLQEGGSSELNSTSSP